MDSIDSVGNVSSDSTGYSSPVDRNSTLTTPAQPSDKGLNTTPAESAQISTKDTSVLSEEARDGVKSGPGDTASPSVEDERSKRLQSYRENAEADLEGWRTAQKANSGDKDATVQNTKNIMDRTREPFNEGFVQKYKDEHDGKEPSAEEINKAHNEAFLKAFTHERYHFDQAAGIEPDKIDKSFRDPMVKQMLSSFPDKINLTNPDGSEVKDVSINHMLSGIQWHGTDSDSLSSSLVKNTVGNGVNSHLAESLKPTGIYGDFHKNGEEPGHSGIWAGASQDLQKEFLNDPVQGMKKFLENPSQYINDTKEPKTMLFTPLTPEIRQMMNVQGDLSA
ncbi:MAG: hypothetical protein AB2L14_16015 [Candidatus Xenobiia bacterium LiM19]